ncbi:MAG: pilus assembly protein PilM, partial [Candidatus Omnitrophica bacterium]|nr:pilus assembly protein PilM [Candidatus Omnitrophota bacterium]
MAFKLDLNNLPEPLQKVKNFLKTPLFLLESEKIVIGLDVGSDSVKIAVLKDEPKRTQLIALGSAKIQGGALEGGAPEGGSEIISATGEIIEGGPGSIDPDILIQAIKDAVLDTQQKIKTRVVSSLKKDHVHVRTINVVYMPEEELNEGIRWEAEQYIPFPMSEALLDYMVLGDTTEAGVDKLETLVVAAQRADVENFVDTVSQADLSIGSLSLESFGLWQTLAKGRPLKNDEPVALVNIG